MILHRLAAACLLVAGLGAGSARANDVLRIAMDRLGRADNDGCAG
jgi:hypothetical protein